MIFFSGVGDICGIHGVLLKKSNKIFFCSSVQPSYYLSALCLIYPTVCLSFCVSVLSFFCMTLCFNDLTVLQTHESSVILSSTVQVVILSVVLSVPVCLFVCMSVRSPVNPFFYLSIRLSVPLSLYIRTSFFLLFFVICHLFRSHFRPSVCSPFSCSSVCLSFIIFQFVCTVSCLYFLPSVQIHPRPFVHLSALIVPVRSSVCPFFTL